jgi:uncharacterized protein YcgI (DUF1989 family)
VFSAAQPRIVMVPSFYGRRTRNRNTSDAGGVSGVVILDEIVPAGRPWGHVVRGGEILRLVDLEGQQPVDFLCFDAADRGDRYSATNTIKVRGKIYLGSTRCFIPIVAAAVADDRPPCPCCGGHMIIVESFGRGGKPRAPPSPQASTGTAMS